MMNIYMKSIKIKAPCTFMAIKDHGFHPSLKWAFQANEVSLVSLSKPGTLPVYLPSSLTSSMKSPDDASPALATPSRSCRIWACTTSLSASSDALLHRFLICWIFFSSTHCPQTAATLAIPRFPRYCPPQAECTGHPSWACCQWEKSLRRKRSERSSQRLKGYGAPGHLWSKVL